MRRSVILLVVGGLIVGSLGAPAMAKKKKKPKPAPAPVSVDQKFFLRSSGCTGDNFDYLSLEDADDEVQCFHTAAGVRNEVGQTTGDACVPDPTTGGERCAVSSRETATRYFDALDGVPIVLDTTKAVTGTVWTAGATCPTALTCSPTPLSAGTTKLDVSLVGRIGEEEILIGEQSESYQVQPGTVHEVKIEMKIDPAHAGKVFDTIELRTWQGGTAAGHGVINTNGETSSFISVPSFLAS